MPRLEPHAVARLAAMTITSFMLGGCVDRALLVESTPPGARVYVDGRDKGTTPLRLPYVHDGTFRVRLEMEGHESVTDEIVTRTAPDAVPGVDFFAENLWPGRVRRQEVRHYDLQPLSASYTEAEMQAFLRRADAFRARTGKEVAEPGTPTPHRPEPAPTPPAPRPPAGR